jgi:hypothetical protein
MSEEKFILVLPIKKNQNLGAVGKSVGNMWPKVIDPRQL